MDSVGWILYAVSCVLWGIFAGRMQIKMGYRREPFFRNPWFVGFGNAVIMPIALVIAAVRVTVPRREV